MKNYKQLFFGLILGFGLAFGFCYFGIWPFNRCGMTTKNTVSLSPANDGGDSLGATVTVADARLFIDNYKLAIRNTTLDGQTGIEGGRIGAVNLRALLAQCPPTSPYLNFRIGYRKETSHPFNRYVVLLFSAGKIYDPNNNLLIYRNAGTSFCPTQCD